jgi:hypothetical protein
MDESNSALVGYSLVPAKGLHDYYDEAYLGGPALWAEPSIPDAARWMLAFADDSPLRKRIGEKARSDSIRREADAARRAPFEALAEAFGQGFLRSARHRLVRRCVTNLRYRGLMRAAVNPRRVGHLIQRVLGRR